uniref:PRL2-17 n=1 Tax=Streptomyces sp. 44414 TaxID=364103 RepID=Q2LET5_9ACTN|nr:hypothetical protein [Streptomyces sp. 44414]ABC67380.1 pRL2-17 [Streptomyces sp. 44414]
MTTPIRGARDAYAEAPPIARETVALLRLRRELGPDRPSYYPPASVNEIREVLLREAALIDRLALEDPEANGDALKAALELKEFDTRQGLGPGATFEGVIPPYADQWQDEPRGYVRQEYHHWLTVPPWKPTLPPAPEDPTA